MTVLPIERNKEILSSESAISFSSSRGSMHSLGLQDEDQAVFVVANAGGQLMASHHYQNRKSNLTSQSIMRNHEHNLAGYMMSFTRPQDVYVFGTTDPYLSSAHFTTVANSFEQVGIELTRNFAPMKNVEDDFQKNGLPVVPQVLTPSLLQAEGEYTAAEANPLAYRKDITERVWREAGAPVPPTMYVRPFDTMETIATQLEEYKQYDELVINIVDGSGGFGLSFVPYKDAFKYIEQAQKESKSENVLQIQGKLPLAGFPDITFNVGKDNIDTILIAKQRFYEPGAYGGTEWTRNAGNEIEAQFPGFNTACNQGIKALQDFGVRGQVNFDVLTITEEDAKKYGVPPITLREANVRSSGPSMIVRLRDEAQINNRPAESIITSVVYKAPPDVILHGQWIDEVNQESDMKAVLYSYNKEGTMYMAFVGNDNVTISELEQYEESTLYRLHAWR